MVASIVILGVWSATNLMRVDRQGIISDFAVVYQILSTVVILGVVLLIAPKLSSTEFVFTRYHNETGFENT